MREDISEVRQGGKLNIGPDKSVESSGRADVDASEDGDHAATDKSSIERIVQARINLPDPSGKGCRIVSSQCPQGAAGGDVAANAGNQCR